MRENLNSKIRTDVVPVSTGCRPKNKGGLKVTGNIKDVMKESSDISYTVARNIVRGTEYESFFNDNLIHLHFPEGATPKDGPSGTVFRCSFHSFFGFFFQIFFDFFSKKL